MRLNTPGRIDAPALDLCCRNSARILKGEFDMAIDYAKTARELLEAIGGAENVSQVIHCATRLRFTLRDDGKADAEAAKRVGGVITIIQKGGQFQAVIGNTVPEVYREVVKISGGDAMPDEAADAPKGSIMTRLIDVISGVFPPLLGAMCGAGLIKGLMGLCVAAGLITNTSGTYIVLNAIGDSVFYFLPILLGFSAGRKFGGNPFVSALVGCSLIYPSIVELGRAGATITFIKIPMVLINYSSSVIPIMLASWLCCRLEKFFNARFPTAVKNFVTPMCSLLITVPLTLLVIGPVCVDISGALADGYQFLFELSPMIAGGLIGAGWQVLVIFGMHWGFIPLMINNIALLGFNTLSPCAQAAALSQTGAAFGMSLKMKNKATRSMTTSTVISGIFGITEPIIYGVTLPRKKPFILGCVGGAIGGAVTGVIGGASYSMGALGILALPSSVSAQGIGRGFWGTLAGMAVSFVVAALLCVITYKDDTLV